MPRGGGDVVHITNTCHSSSPLKCEYSGLLLTGIQYFFLFQTLAPEAFKISKILNYLKK